MKKILIAAGFVFSAFSFGQVYSNNYPNSGYSEGYYGQSYGDNLDYSNFPDEYFYEYPSDYYPSQYYQSYYNDYRQSIVNINWNRFIAEFNLSPWQVREIAVLNRRFPSYSSWYSYYGSNPDRWYYDRFYALQQILGPQIYVVFRNNYYRGYDPVVYFNDYRRTYYAPRYAVVPRYRSVDPSRYRVSRDRFMENRGRFTDNVQNNNRGGFQRNGSNGGFNSSSSNGLSGNSRTSDGFRGQQSQRSVESAPRTNNGFRNNTPAEPNRQPEPQRSNTSGMRGGFTERMVNQQPASSSGGFRNGSSQGATQNRQGGFR